MQDEVEEVERRLVALIIKHLEQEKLDPNRAKQLSTDFLALLPFSDKKDLLSKLQTLSQSYEEAQEVYVEELATVHEKETEQKLIQMRNLIQQGKIEDAISIAKTRAII